MCVSMRALSTATEHEHASTEHYYRACVIEYFSRPDSVAEILANSRSVEEDAVSGSDRAKGIRCGDDHERIARQ